MHIAGQRVFVHSDSQSIEGRGQVHGRHFPGALTQPRMHPDRGRIEPVRERPEVAGFGSRVLGPGAGP